MFNSEPTPQSSAKSTNPFEGHHLDLEQVSSEQNDIKLMFSSGIVIGAWTDFHFHKSFSCKNENSTKFSISRSHSLASTPIHYRSEMNIFLSLKST